MYENSKQFEQYQYIGKVLENIHPSVTVMDKNGIFVYIGNACKDFFGEEADSLVGENVCSPQVTKVFHPCVSQMVLETQKKMTITQKNSNGETTFVTGIPIFDKHDKLELIICFSSWDITNYEDLKTHFEQLREENEDLLRQINRLTKEDALTKNLIGKSRNIQDATRLLQIFSKQDLPAFIYGPVGCGKTYLCKTVYGQSGILYEYNCDLVSPESIALDLFGSNDKKGILDSKGYHAILLYHIELLPASLQRRLIEHIKQNHLVVIGAAPKSLETLKKEKKVSDELYYFFKSYQVEVLSINERPEDLQGFLDYYIQTFNSKYQKNISFSPRAMNCLLGYHYKDNIIGIRYIVERLILTADKNYVDVYQLPKEFTRYSDELFLQNESLKDMMELYERGIIKRAYKKYHTTIEVAKRLGISQATAARKIIKYVGKKNI